MTTKSKMTVVAKDKSRTLTSRLKSNQTRDAAEAEMMVEGLAMNAVTAISFSKMLGELDLTESMAALIVESRRVQSGNLAGPEAMLIAQAVTLNAMFTQLAYHSSQMTIVDQVDRFTRLALKAQGQCRATLETLAAIKNPPVLFAKQANIANGPQQVNNTMQAKANPMDNSDPMEGRVGVSRARAAKPESQPIKLLEHGANVERIERVDTGAASASCERDQNLATMGARHRPANR